MPDLKTKAAHYHAQAPAGKVAIAVTKPCASGNDLSLAYTPGVGSVCQEIADQPEKVWDYTNRGNTVAVISDGTAILGMGNIGAEAGIPVMEGKAILFKKFADIDAYPLCMRLPGMEIDDPEYPAAYARLCASLEPTLAAYNLEDIKAPQCFAIQEELEKLVDIPVFHDDQDGTAIILVAGLLNALRVVEKDLKDLKIVFNGAGAAGIAIVKLLLEFGVEKDQMWLCDRKGLVTSDRENLHWTKAMIARDHAPQDLAATMEGADVFIGVSTRDLVNQEMAASMADDAIIFAVANPVPEIMPEVAHAAGVTVIGTGRSDYPNQVNNSLGFPGLFRGVLDVRSKTINREMRIAATKALADLACEPFPKEVSEQLKTAYPLENDLGIFDRESPVGHDYVIPKQFDLRVVPRVARAVAEAAMETGVAQIPIEDLDAYEAAVEARMAELWK